MDNRPVAEKLRIRKKNNEHGGKSVREMMNSTLLNNYWTAAVCRPTST